MDHWIPPPPPPAASGPPSGSGHVSQSAAAPMLATPGRAAVLANERGLIEVVRQAYLAPGGHYETLYLSHTPGCHNDTHEFCEEVRAVVARLCLKTFDFVENACNAVLASRGCPGCRFDRDTTLGFYARFHTPEGSSQSFSPSSMSSSASQLTCSGSAFPPLASDPMVPSVEIHEDSIPAPSSEH